MKRIQLSSNIRHLILMPKNEFKKIYEESGISTPFYEYVKKSTYILVTISIITFVSSIIVHKILYQCTHLQNRTQAVTLKHDVHKIPQEKPTNKFAENPTDHSAHKNYYSLYQN